jgi:serine/threonine protein phosphatase PrpC
MPTKPPGKPPGKSPGTVPADVLGDWLFLDRDMAEPEPRAIARGEAVVYSSRSPVKESANQDAAALIPYNGRSCILAVADGMGGGPAGERAADIALRSLQATVADLSRDDQPLRGAILDGIERANAEIVALGLGAATTLAAVEIQDGTVRPYHVGDSMILVVGQRGRIKLQTVSHSPVGFAVESGLLDEREAMHHEDRHLVSNVIGMANMRIEIGPSLALAERDTLLLASDGLFDNLHVQEIVQRVRKGPLLCGARRLARDSRRRMREPRGDQPSKPDDLTFLCFRRGR